jgi:hypothetical protein
MEKEIKTNKREITNIELVYGSKEDLIGLASKEQFVEFILEDSLSTITKAINENLENVELFNILNLSLIVELDKSNYKNVLGRILQHYVEVEDYDKCIEIQSLINKL